MNLSKKAILAGIVALTATAFIEGYAYDPIRKFGRGISNVAFGVLEIPIRAYDVNFEEGGIASVTYGTLKGIAYFVARECVGVVEIVTFPIPLPGTPDDPHDVGWGTGPIMQPEWIVDTDHNAYNIVYQKSSTMD
jgi:putative exosortase-associated protein (TIGR04073 family)